MNDLIKRLEEAEGADREIDAAIWAHFNDGSVEDQEHVNMKTGERFFLKTSLKGSDGKFRVGRAPTYTESLDAALALVGEILPDHAVGMNEFKHHLSWRANLEKGGVSKGGGFAYHKSPAIALLIALLKAHAVEVE